MSSRFSPSRLMRRRYCWPEPGAGAGAGGVPAAGAVTLVTVPLAVLSSRQSGQVDWLTTPTWTTVSAARHPVRRRLAGGIHRHRDPDGSGCCRVATKPGQDRPRQPRPADDAPAAAAAPGRIPSPVVPYHVRYILFRGRRRAVPGRERTGAAPPPPARRKGGLGCAGRRLAGGRRVRRPVSRATGSNGPPHRGATTSPRPRRSSAAVPGRATPSSSCHADTGLLHSRTRSRSRWPMMSPSARPRSKRTTSAATIGPLRSCAPGCWRPLGVWVIGRPHLNVRAGERDAASARQVLQDHFIRERSYAVHGLNIVLYVRTGTPR